MGNKAILLGSDSMGRGDEKLGKLLMANFLRLLNDQVDKPDVIACVNYGVKLATAESISVEHLKRLERSGVRVLLCKTCLEYLEIEEQVTCGQVSNMMEIQTQLLHKEVVAL